MKRTSFYFLFALMTFGLSSCAMKDASLDTLPEILPDSEQEKIQEQSILTPKSQEPLTAFDVSKAVQVAVRNMAASGVLNPSSSEKYTLCVTHVLNMTSYDFNVVEIKKALETALAVTKKVRVVSSTSKTIEPQMNISARTTERIAHVRGGKRKEYYLNIVLTEPNVGMTLWSNVTPIIKR